MAVGAEDFSRPPLNPYEPLQSWAENLLSSVEGIVSLLSNSIFDRTELVNLAEEVLSLPYPERFTQSHTVFEAHFQDLIERIKTLPTSFLIDEQQVERQVFEFLDQLMELNQYRTLRGVLWQQEADEYLIVAAYFQIFRRILRSAKLHSRDPETIAALAPCYHALYSRLIILVEDQVEAEEIVRDVIWGDYFISEALGETPSYNPDELSYQEMRQEVVEWGTIIAYQKLGLSVMRCAELAGVTEKEFEDLISSGPVKPTFVSDGLNIHISRHIIRQINNVYEQLGYGSRSEFIRAALKETTVPVLTEDARNRLEMGLKDLEEGRTISHEELKRNMGIED